MFEKPTAQYPLGLEPDGAQLKGALLTLKGGKPKIERLFTAPLVDKENSSHHRTLLNDISPPLQREPLSQSLFVTGLTTQETLIRTLDIKLTKEKDIDAVLNFQAEPLIPYPIDQAILEKVILSKDEAGSQLTLFAVRKDHLRQHLDTFTDHNIEPESVGCYPAALAAFSRAYTLLQEPIFVIHLGPNETTVLLVDDGKVLAGHSSKHTVLPLMDAIKAQDLPSDTIDFASVASNAASPLFPSLEVLRLELSRTIYALSKQARGQEISSILMTGEGSVIGNLAEHLCLALKKANIAPAAAFDPSVSSANLRRFALPIGLALGCLEGAPNRINFRQGEFAYPYPWKRLKRPLAVYVVACVLIFLLIFKLGSQTNSLSLDYARSQYQNLLSVLGTDHPTFEKKAFGTKPEDVIPLDRLSVDAINQRIDWVEKDMQNTPFVFPLVPNIARVSDVLAWLCNNPKVVTIDPVNGEKVALLQIESFNYQMVRRPDKNNPKQHYQVKVEVEFSSKEPMWAREFHDMLISPNEFVDQKNEVKWGATQGRYRTSFFLKDKTYYP